MVMAPIFVKYQDRDGQHYVYDVCSAEILRAGNIIYQILDDYHVLTDSEILTKHGALPENELSDALEQLNEFQSMNVLSDHMPTPTYEVQRIIYGDKSEPVLDFLNHHRRLLTLELTHRCNLACEYCCYGEHYTQNRTGSQAVMPLETAKKAVQQFISHKPTDISISFYGGEPLLEFDLMKETVLFAESVAESDAKDVQFSITTNGTLLTDRVIHFLVKHRFGVTISIDGDKEVHDRYRIFKTKGAAAERKGSYDVVVKNMKRFIELYPDYLARTLAVTLTATSDIGEIEKFIQLWKPKFSAVGVAMVSAVPSNSKVTNEDHPVGLGCGHFSPCDDCFCGRGFSAGEDDRFPGNKSFSENRDEYCTVPEFDNWSNEVNQCQQTSRHAFLVRLCQAEDADAAKSIVKTSVINRTFTRSRVRTIHNRHLLGKGKKFPPAAIRLSCLPGASRTYCSTMGMLYTCEKTEFGKPFIIGNIENDVDPDKAYRLADILRLHCDCGNCILNRLCYFCPALISGCPETELAL